METALRMKLQIENLGTEARIWRIMAQFGNPIDKATTRYLEERGFSDGRTRAVGCMGWIWSQWLLAGNPVDIHASVGPFVQRGMEMQERSTLLHMRPIHDLYLMVCAAFACDEAQLQTLADRAVDASGYKEHRPQNDGELYESAWSGMMKYWILGQPEQAAKQAEIIWGAYRHPSVAGAAKPLVTPWLKGDWKAFVKQQQKDFEKRWQRARKDRTVKSETETEIVVDMQNVASIQQLWCWAHCGMAMLAHRKGVEVATDPFWFPPHALKCAPVGA